MNEEHFHATWAVLDRLRAVKKARIEKRWPWMPLGRSRRHQLVTREWRIAYMPTMGG